MPEKVVVRVRKPYEDVRVVSVPKHVYNVVRSFVESSTKPEYEWNRGVRIGDTVIFEKPGKWKLTVHAGEHEVREGVWPIVAVLSAADTGADVAAIVASPEGLKLRICGANVDINVSDADKYVIVPEERVPFAAPVLARDLVKRFFDYVEVEAQ